MHLSAVGLSWSVCGAVHSADGGTQQHAKVCAPSTVALARARRPSVVVTGGSKLTHAVPATCCFCVIRSRVKKSRRVAMEKPLRVGSLTRRAAITVLAAGTASTLESTRSCSAWASPQFMDGVVGQTLVSRKLKADLTSVNACKASKLGAPGLVERNPGAFIDVFRDVAKTCAPIRQQLLSRSTVGPGTLDVVDLFEVR